MKKDYLIRNELISVIVPVYNSEKMLSECIKSILNQTYKYFELILIDDGSNDNSYEICKKYKCIDQRIKVLYQKNAGASAARNAGIRYSTGKYILFVDSDDFIDNNMFQNLIYVAETQNADFVMCGMIVDIYNSYGKLVSSKKCELTPRIITENKKIPQKIIDLVDNEKISGPYCKLIRRDIIYANNIIMPVNISLQEDLYFNLKVLEYVKKMIVIKECYYHYRKGLADSVTSRFYQDKFDMTNAVHNLLVEFYMNRCNDINILKRINYIYIKNTYAACINLFHPNCNMSKQKKLEYIEKIIKSDKYSNIISFSYKKGFKYNILKFIMKIKSQRILYYSSKVIYIMKFKMRFSY